MVCLPRSRRRARRGRALAADFNADARRGMAVVFQRPLPYLYLARYVFADAEQPYQALDTLPLAAEPFAAALDVVFAFLLAEANRASTVDLLARPTGAFPPARRPDLVRREQVAALDVLLRERKYLGGWDRLAALALAHTADRAPDATSRRFGKAHGRSEFAAGPGRSESAESSAAWRPRLPRESCSGPCGTPPRPRVRFARCSTSSRAHERLPIRSGRGPPGTFARARPCSTRSVALPAAHARSRRSRRCRSSASPAVVRRWIDGQTFAPSTGSDGVVLLDAPAAAYADVDELRLVGLVETDWPERDAAEHLLSVEPAVAARVAERDRSADRGARAIPRSASASASTRLGVDLHARGRRHRAAFVVSRGDRRKRADDRAADRSVPAGAVFAHDSLFDDAAGDAVHAMSAESRGLAGAEDVRVRRPTPHLHGFAGPARPRSMPSATSNAISIVRSSISPRGCFGLDEERDDESGLSPLERGQLLHEVFETFFNSVARARAAGRSRPRNLDDALELFASVAESTLATTARSRPRARTNVPPRLGCRRRARRACVQLRDRTGERPSSSGCWSIRSKGSSSSAVAEGPREVSIRAKADRIDLLEDGTLRVIDYKLSRAPKPARALQLPIYGVCAEQHLAGRHGPRLEGVARGIRGVQGEERVRRPRGSSTTLEQALEEGEHRLVAAVDGIERGEFPVQPEEPYRCRWCGYAGVCRKDYIGDE